MDDLFILLVELQMARGYSRKDLVKQDQESLQRKQARSVTLDQACFDHALQSRYWESAASDESYYWPKPSK